MTFFHGESEFRNEKARNGRKRTVFAKQLFNININNETKKTLLEAVSIKTVWFSRGLRLYIKLLGFLKKIMFF